MLLVRTYLDRSNIHGIGLFAAEPIPKGTLVWRLHPTLDIQLSDETIASLATPARQQILKYTYKDLMLGTHVLCGDDARFFNHDPNPNCRDIPDREGGTTTAARDIAAGEELTCDYASFDALYGHEPYVNGQ
jgi:SET domain-containing protein